MDIGIPADLVQRESYPVTSVDRSRVSLPVRPRDAHKGDFGRVYILGGSVGLSGAPVMAAQAAVRTGAGLVTVGVPAPIWSVAATKLDEAMPHPLPAGKDGKLELAATRAAAGEAGWQVGVSAGPRSGPVQRGGRGGAACAGRDHPACGAGCRRHKCAGGAYGCTG